MSKRKVKSKGVQYIAQSLNRYFPKKYPKYSVALPKSREVFAELQSLNQKVTLNNVFALVRKKRVGKKGAPYIDPKLLSTSYYFELVDYPVYIARCSNELWFKSKLFPSGSGDVQGGKITDYEKYFSSFVNYANSMAALTDPDEKRYDTEWNVKCTVPVYNKAKKRWESELMSIDAKGNQFDYGFDSKKPTKEAKTVQLTSEPEKGDAIVRKEPELESKAQVPVSTAKGGAERVKEIRALIADLRQDVKDGLISKEDYAKMVKELTSKLEDGGQI